MSEIMPQPCPRCGWETGIITRRMVMVVYPDGERAWGEPQMTYVRFHADKQIPWEDAVAECPACRIAAMRPGSTDTHFRTVDDAIRSWNSIPSSIYDDRSRDLGRQMREWFEDRLREREASA